ncbi:uncharacterized protein LOC129798432 [Phlebotomus papatasi]|uniref:uncharacterized protein LOC129798432 n=1 Tax=Phlebotomus papatasi TaxID=29031 RepID=UPI002483CE32|nr:uncharacterized protein LOC129798432 [Phlebotomus papatasi]
MKIHAVIFLFSILLRIEFSSAFDYVLEAYKWKTLWYDNQYKSVNRDNLLPTSVVYYPERGYLFIGIKRDCPAIPATLNVIDVKKHRPGSSPPLSPFPNYELNDILSQHVYGKTNTDEVFDEPTQNFKSEDNESEKRRDKPDANDVSSSSNLMPSYTVFSSNWNNTQSFNYRSQTQAGIHKNSGQYPQTGHYTQPGQQHKNPNKPYVPVVLPSQPSNPSNPNWNNPGHQNPWLETGLSDQSKYPFDNMNSQAGNFKPPPPDYLTGSHPGSAVGPVPGSIPGASSDNNWGTRRPKPLISVTSMTIDKCERLWLTDSGVMRQENRRSVIYRPSLWIFDLTFGERLGDYNVIRRVELPREIVETGEGIGGVTVDVRDGSSCDFATAYVTNFLDNTIAVYSFQKADGWVFQHFSFKPDSQESQFFFDGFSYTAHHGINSMALGWREAHGYSTVFYQSFSSSGLYATSTSVLQTKSLAPKNYNRHDFKFVGYRGCSSRSPALVFDQRHGVIFFASVQSKSLSCWNVKKSLHPENIGNIPVSHDNNNQKSLNIDSRGDLWVISNGRLQCSFPPLQGNRSYSSSIYRINIGNAIRGTVCAPSEFKKSSKDDEGNQYIGDDPIEDAEYYKNYLTDYLTNSFESESEITYKHIQPEDATE